MFRPAASALLPHPASSCTSPRACVLRVMPRRLRAALLRLRPCCACAPAALAAAPAAVAACALSAGGGLRGQCTGGELVISGGLVKSKMGWWRVSSGKCVQQEGAGCHSSRQGAAGGHRQLNPPRFSPLHLHPVPSLYSLATVLGPLGAPPQRAGTLQRPSCSALPGLAGPGTTFICVARAQISGPGGPGVARWLGGGWAAWGCCRRHCCCRHCCLLSALLLSRLQPATLAPVSATRTASQRRGIAGVFGLAAWRVGNCRRRDPPF